MTEERIQIGMIDRKPIFLYKHSWDCDWYWGMGYLGNNNYHYHFDSLLESAKCGPQYHFTKCIFNQDQWWIMRDLFVQAYALKKAAEVYQYGGHQTTKAGVTDLIKDKEMAARINVDLKTVLDKIWEFTQEVSREHIEQDKKAS